MSYPRKTLRVVMALGLAAMPARAQTAPEPPPAQPPPEPPARPAVPAPVFMGQPPGVLQRANTWDLNLEGGYGKELNDGGKWLGWGRLRAGLLLVREPRYLMLGATAELASRQRVTLGLQGELADATSGLWLQAGPTLDVRGNFGGMLAVGLSFLGVEIQRRPVDGLGDSTILLGKLRLPLGVIYHVATH